MLIEAFRAERLRQRPAPLEEVGDSEQPEPAGSDPAPAPEPARASDAPAICTCGHHGSPPFGTDLISGRAYDLPLAEIGVGPAMTMRLGQLGLHTSRDLAGVDAKTLHMLLGDVSRLLDLDAWINTARRKLAQPPWS